MEHTELESLRYPIGKFQLPAAITDDLISRWIDALEEYPDRLNTLVTGLSEEQLETPYRPEGWTVRQLVHHISDSHHNSYIRFKWALTEEMPVIKVYDEKKWAELHDTRNAPISLSLAHLKAVHSKLVFLLRGLNRADLKKKFIHPDGNEETSLEENIGRYVWHGNHHFAHITSLLRRNNWA
ncbi:MAG: YfiT family bacillithiol transferase [Flavobacteriaceae bacterium]